jgi:WD40 repeat protein
MVMTFAPDNKVLATGHTDGTVKLWDLATGKPRSALAAGTSPDALLFTSDSKTLVTVNKGDSVARVWDVQTGKRKSIVNLETPALAATLIPGRLPLLATVGQDGTLKLWNLATQKQQTAPLKLGKDRAFPMAFAVSPDGRTMAASFSEQAPMEFALRQVVRVWNLPANLQVGK